MFLSEIARTWMPNWVINHPAILSFDSKISKIFESHFQVKDFREQLINDLPKKEFKNFLKQQIFKLLDFLYPSPYQDLELVTHQFLNQLNNSQLWELEKPQLLLPIKSNQKSLTFPLKTSIVKVYNRLREESKKLGFELESLETSTAFKHYSKRGNLELVFSTNPEDLLAMSSRSNWTSCQTLSTTKTENRRVIGSALSSSIGLLYLTSGRSFQNRGEEMLSRSLLRLALDSFINNQYVFLIDQLYPSFDKNLITLMLNKFQAHSPIPVYSVDLLEAKKKNHNRFILPHSDIPFLPSNEHSFIDCSHLYQANSLSDSHKLR